MAENMTIVEAEAWCRAWESSALERGEDPMSRSFWDRCWAWVAMEILAGHTTPEAR